MVAESVNPIIFPILNCFSSDTFFAERIRINPNTKKKNKITIEGLQSFF